MALFIIYIKLFVNSKSCDMSATVKKIRKK